MLAALNTISTTNYSIQIGDESLDKLSVFLKKNNFSNIQISVFYLKKMIKNFISKICSEKYKPMDKSFYNWIRIIEHNKKDNYVKD